MTFWRSKSNSAQVDLANMSDPEIASHVISELKMVFEKSPPTLGVVGVSGTGKSSTLNAMFGTDFAVSGSKRGTTEVSSKDVELIGQRGPTKDDHILLRVFDAPGLGEDIRKDDEYITMYRETLPKCDAILWVMTARNRAIALDQKYLYEFSDVWDRIVFCINQADLTDPLNWDKALNSPSDGQKENLNIIVEDRQSRLAHVLGRTPSITPYSAANHFGLMNVMEEVSKIVPDNRKWMFESLRKATSRDWLDRVEGLSEDEKRQISGDNRKTSKGYVG